ncbi:MAG: MFS transporter, partial [bacterium]|nr:MFS transporter [bacterium]
IFHLRFSRPVLVIKLLLPEIFIGFGAGLVIPFMNVFLARRLAASSAQIGYIFSLEALWITIAVLAAPLLSARYGKIGTTIVTRVISVPILLGIALSGNLWVVAIAIWLRSSFMNLSSPLVQNFTMEVLEQEERATVNSVIFMLKTLGMAIGARMGGVLMVRYSYTIPYFIAALAYTISAVLFFMFFANKEQHYMLDSKESSNSN